MLENQDEVGNTALMSAGESEGPAVARDRRAGSCCLELVRPSKCDMGSLARNSLRTAMQMLRSRLRLRRFTRLCSHADSRLRAVQPRLATSRS